MTKPAQNILQYSSDIWATADLLIGAGIKQSDFPKFMMPFFGLVLMESRLVRKKIELLEEFGIKTEKPETADLTEILDEQMLTDFIEEFQDLEFGYNDEVIRKGNTLLVISGNDKTFGVDYQTYLKAFDEETKSLLGVDRGSADAKFLDISGFSGQLAKKGILLASVKKWASINLLPFNNSEITTLEEHIKRKWADISAETAGEQYTPDDVIDLIAAIVSHKIDKKENEYITIYDPTCGGGNMLFGVEDFIKRRLPNRPTKTFGQDWSDSLYAFAKIESRFRGEAQIEYGNTLVDTKFLEKNFDVVIANPPYGVDWKGYQKEIKQDKTGRFVALPSISDGQLLFMQHIVYHLANDGISVVVHNGSTLFSGDAGSGESNIRKYLFEQDWVEAIVQLPTDEFFNTGIYTYLWIFNKNKSVERKDKVMLINASEHFTPLKKSRGNKRKKIDTENRKIIVQTLLDYKETDFAKVFDKDAFFFNKQAIYLTNLDVNGKTIESEMPTKINTKTGEEIRAKVIVLNDIQTVSQGDIILSEMTIADDSKTEDELKAEYDTLKTIIGSLDYKDEAFKVVTENATYHYDSDKETVIETTNDSVTELGCGKIEVKASFKKQTTKRSAQIDIKVGLTPDYEKDYEIISYSRDEAENQCNITDFMAKYITRPFIYLDNTVGVEINFNKVFYQPETLRPIADVLIDLEGLDEELKSLETALNL
jgi:type I restriction enzyme M protein